MIVEAKYDLRSLLNDEQMKKSVKVVYDMATILKKIKHEIRKDMKDYQIITSFLWYCHDLKNGIYESNLVEAKYMTHILEGLSRDIVNILIHKENSSLTNSFVFKNKLFHDLNDF